MSYHPSQGGSAKVDFMNSMAAAPYDGRMVLVGSTLGDWANANAGDRDFAVVMLAADTGPMSSPALPPVPDTSTSPGDATSIIAGTVSAIAVLILISTAACYVCCRRPTAKDPYASRPRALSHSGGVGQAVLEAARELAQHSQVPGVAAAAMLMSILVKLVLDNRGNIEEAKRRLILCRSVVMTIQRAAKVFEEVGRKSVSYLYDIVGCRMVATFCLALQGSKGVSRSQDPVILFYVTTPY